MIKCFSPFNTNSFQLYLESNIKHLSISIHTNNPNQYFKASFSKEDLTLLNNNFSIFSSIDEIHKLLLKYIETNNRNITINQTASFFELKFPNFFNEHEITFILPITKYNSISFSFQTTKITSITHNILNSNFIISEHESSIKSKYFLLFHFFISLLLLILLGVFCFKYAMIFKFIGLSSIATRNDFAMISKWIDPKYVFKYTLLYKATRDGGESLIFHKLCDNKGMTLTLIHTLEGWKFGGYADVNWMSAEDPAHWNFKEGKNIFIFSLNLKKKYPPFSRSPGLFCSGNKGPSFGHGLDISVSSNCLMEKSLCNAPSSFLNMEKTNELNGRKKEFLVKEMEVYKVEEISFIK